MAALSSTDCISSNLDKSSPKSPDPSSPTILECGASTTTSSMDTEKGQRLACDGDAEGMFPAVCSDTWKIDHCLATGCSVHSLCWRGIWTTVASVVLHPVQWCNAKRQVAANKKKKFQLHYSDIKTTRRKSLSPNRIQRSTD